jgi:tripartite-type tricarboxylate transporter receptor subunit TctC
MTYDVTRRAALSGIGALLTSSACPADAEDYPSRVIKILTGFPPGGNADAVGRILADQLEKRLGQAFIVEAKPGASGSVASEVVARSAPDGYLLMVASNVHPMYGALSKRTPYDVVNDFTWISTATFFPYIICVRADSRFQTLTQLIDAARSKPAALNYGGGQIGTGMHMVVELMANQSKSSFVRIPYRGEHDAVVALLAGDVDFIAANAGPVTEQIRAGALRALAVTGKKRWQGLLDVPTVAESGLEDFDITGWMGLAGPAGLPPSIVNRLSAEMREIIAMPEVQARFATLGGEPQAMTPLEMRSLVERQFKTWKKLAADANLKID